MSLEMYNINTNVQVEEDLLNEVVRVKDSYGEFLPFTSKYWFHNVEYPYLKHFKDKGKPIQFVIDIFLKEHRFNYICYN